MLLHNVYCVSSGKEILFFFSRAYCTNKASMTVCFSEENNKKSAFLF